MSPSSSNALWQSDFAGDPKIIGQVIRVNARPTTVIGVMPPGFEFPRDQIWIPIFNEYPYAERPWGAVNAVAKLKPGVSLDQAHAEFGAYLQRLAKEYPRTNERFTVPRIEPVLNNFIARPTRQLLLAMLGSALAVLLIACANVPQFTAAAFSTRRNMLTNDNPLRLELEGRTYIRPEDRIEAWGEFVSDGYIATLGLRPLRGREFEPVDRDERRFVAMVNESFAPRHFGGEDPIGRRLRFNERDQWRTIIGVVPDTLMQGPMEQRRDGAGVFLSIEADPVSYLTLVVRGHAQPSGLAETVRREILKVNPNLGIYSLGTPRELMKTILAQPRTTASLFAVFGGVAMLLAAVGLKVEPMIALRCD